MHLTIGEALNLVTALKRELGDLHEVEVVLCPPFTALDQVSDAIQGSLFHLGAQDTHWEPQGASTGEISPVMLKDLGCHYVIIGHSERRQHFGETDESCNKKLKAACKHGLTPIYCVGETLEERELNETFFIVQRQLDDGLDGLSAADLAKLVIAYEPVWAIGTGKNATAEQAQAVHQFIRTHLVKLANESVAQAIRIQYGGSVKPENIAELIAEEDVDGALVGGASLKADQFAAIVKTCARLTKKVSRG